MVLRASPRTRAPSSPTLFILRLWPGSLEERGGEVKSGFEIREERRARKEEKGKVRRDMKE